MEQERGRGRLAEIAQAMQQWTALGYTRGTDVMAVALRLDAVHALAKARIDEVHRQHGLSPGDFDVLATLFRAGTAPVAPTYLARHLLSSKSGITGRLHRLEGQGLIERLPNEEDRRGSSVALTGRGRAVVEALLPEHIEAEAHFLADLSPAELASLDSVLAKVLRRAGG